MIAAAGRHQGRAVGENLHKALDWLPMARKLVTVVTDCDLSRDTCRLPLRWTLALQPVDRPACSTSSRPLRLQDLARPSEGTAGGCPPAEATSVPRAWRARPAGAEAPPRRPSTATNGARRASAKRWIAASTPRR